MKRWLLLPLATAVLTAACAGREEDKLSKAQKKELMTHYRSGMGYLKDGELDKATEAFNRCLGIDPDHYEAHLRLGAIYLKQKKLDLAASELGRAVQSEPDSVGARLLFSAVLHFQGRQYESARELRRVLAIDPEHLTARLQLGHLLMSPDFTVLDLEEWGRQFEKVLEIDANSPDVYLGLAQVELMLGQFSQAAETFKILVDRYPPQFRSFYLLGVSYLRGRDYARAIPVLKEALKIQPGELQALWSLKIAYDREGGYPEDLPETYRLNVFQEKVPAPGVKFTEVAIEAGVGKVDEGRGSAWGDYDRDGDLDLFTVGHYAPYALYRNNGDGTFTDVAGEAGVDDPRGGWAALFADYDNDGDLDLYVTRDGWFGKGPNALYRNNGDGTFTDVTLEAGVSDTGSSFCAAFGDYDNDGYLDLYIADGVVGDGSPNRLYHNNGDGTFTDVASQAGVDHKGRGIGVAFGDYDNDGYLDIHLVNLDEPNVLYHNKGNGTFTDVTEAAGLTTPIRQGFVTFFFDYDNDRDLDIFISTHGSFRDFIRSKIHGKADEQSDRPVLYRNNGDGTFTDVTLEAGLYRSFGAMGANFGDMDNDGYQDLYLANGGPAMGRLEPDAVFRNNGDGTFSEVTDLVGVDSLGKGHGVTFGDYDGDGDLDFYLPIGGAYVGDQWPNRLYRNEGNRNNWLTVELVGTRSNRDGIGAKVTVTTGSFSRYGEVSGGCGFGSTNSLPLEFGLGSSTKVDGVEVRWPSGDRQVLRNLPVNRTITVIEGP